MKISDDVKIDLTSLNRTEFESIVSGLEVGQWTGKVLKWNNGDIVIATKNIVYKISDGAIIYLLVPIKNISSQINNLGEHSHGSGKFQVCSYCSDVVDSGKWVDLEKYVNDSLSLNRSHGICPSCLYLLQNSIDCDIDYVRFDDMNDVSEVDINIRQQKIKNSYTKKYWEWLCIDTILL